MTPDGPTEPDRQFYQDYMQFYRQWALDTLGTWELPVPMRPELTGPSFYPLSSVSGAGVVLFVPWYLLRDKDITLRELAEHNQIADLPQSLVPWIDGTPKNWGHERYQLMLELFVYLELCLARRYADRLKSNRERLDLAFSRHYCIQKDQLAAPARMLETIRKTRQEMNRRLSCTERCKLRKSEMHCDFNHNKSPNTVRSNSQSSARRRLSTLEGSDLRSGRPSYCVDSRFVSVVFPVLSRFASHFPANRPNSCESSKRESSLAEVAAVATDSSVILGTSL